MTSPAAPHREHSNAAGIEAGGSVARLDPTVYRDQRWCIRCAGKALFVEVFETEFGRVGVCYGCGEERVIPFSRTTEAAC